MKWFNILITKPITLFLVVSAMIIVFSIPIATIGFIGYLIDNYSIWYILLFIPFWGILFHIMVDLE